MTLLMSVGCILGFMAGMQDHWSWGWMLALGLGAVVFFVAGPADD